MNQVLQWSYDLTKLFLGGNDITEDVVPCIITNKTEEVVQQTEGVCNSRVVRNIRGGTPKSSSTQLHCTPILHKTESQTINRTLKRQLSDHPFVHLSAQPFQRDQNPLESLETAVCAGEI